MNKKKILALTAAFAVAISIMACNNNPNDNRNDDGYNTQDQMNTTDPYPAGGTYDSGDTMGTDTALMHNNGGNPM